MAQILSQGPCPYCASHDAYTTYVDGGYHCFSCGAHQGENPYKTIKQKLNMRGTVILEIPPLPEDVVELPSNTKAHDWVKSYGITDAEIVTNEFLWSEEKSLLIYPVSDPAVGLLMWQARYFGDKPRHPKYLTRGLKDSVIHIIGADKKGPLVLTEDLLSAIKVGRQQAAMPLWGSALSREMAQRLSIVHKDIRLWLDYDKREEAIKISLRHCLFLDIVPIITKLDPKCYDDDEITEYLKDDD